MARCVGERIQRRGEIVVVCLVIVIVWGLLTLPIIFYHLRRYQVGMAACRHCNFYIVQEEVTIIGPGLKSVLAVIKL